jgi:hypothetical protein
VQFSHTLRITEEFSTCAPRLDRHQSVENMEKAPSIDI